MNSMDAVTRKQARSEDDPSRLADVAETLGNALVYPVVVLDVWWTVVAFIGGRMPVLGIQTRGSIGFGIVWLVLGAPLVWTIHNIVTVVAALPGYVLIRLYHRALNETLESLLVGVTHIVVLGAVVGIWVAGVHITDLHLADNNPAATAPADPAGLVGSCFNLTLENQMGVVPCAQAHLGKVISVASSASTCPAAASGYLDGPATTEVLCYVSG